MVMRAMPMIAMMISATRWGDEGDEQWSVR